MMQTNLILTWNLSELRRTGSASAKHKQIKSHLLSQTWSKFLRWSFTHQLPPEPAVAWLWPVQQESAREDLSAHTWLYIWHSRSDIPTLRELPPPPATPDPHQPEKLPDWNHIEEGIIKETSELTQNTIPTRWLWHHDQPTPSSSPSPPTPNPARLLGDPIPHKHTAPHNAPKLALTWLIWQVFHTFLFSGVVFPSPEGIAAHLLGWGAHCWLWPYYANDSQWCCTVSNVFAIPLNLKPLKRCHS